MKSMHWVVSMMMVTAALATAAEETDATQAELKALRVNAYKEPEVKAAREKLDTAYREYWDAVRAAMKRLDPSKAALIDQDVDGRKKKPAVAGEPKAARTAD